MSPQPSQEIGQLGERKFSLKFSMVLFAFQLFVLLKLHKCTNFSFHLPASVLPQLFLIDESQEFQLCGGKTCAFDSTVIISLEIVPGCQLREFTDVVMVCCWYIY